MAFPQFLPFWAGENPFISNASTVVWTRVRSDGPSFEANDSFHGRARLYGVQTQRNKMSKAEIDKWNAAKDGELNEANMIKKLQAMGFKCDRHQYETGKSFEEHDHKEESRDCVVSGSVEVVVHGDTIKLGAGDMLHIPPHTSHSCKCTAAAVFIDAQK
ncbi:hypothetical protein ScPMuIL_006916 [Solemya velum]